jgi:hypothetical protein
MIAATGLPESNFNNSCFNGVYPISIGKRANEIIELKPGLTLKKEQSFTPVELANTRTT